MVRVIEKTFNVCFLLVSFTQLFSNRSTPISRLTAVDAFVPIASQGLLLLPNERLVHQKNRNYNRNNHQLKFNRIYSSPSSSSSSSGESSSKSNDKSNAAPSLEQIRAWRERARQLYREASEEEMALKRERQNKEQRLDDFIQNELFVASAAESDKANEQVTNNTNHHHKLNVEVLKGMSTKKILEVWDRLLARKKQVSISSSTASTFNIADSNNSQEGKENELKLLEQFTNKLLEAQLKIDNERQENNQNNRNKSVAGILLSKLNDWQRMEDFNLSRQVPSQKSQLKDEDVDFVRQTMGDSDIDAINATTITIKLDGKRITTTMAESQNVTQLVNDLLSIPVWVPSYFLSYVVTATSNDLTQKTAEQDKIDWRYVKNVIAGDPDFYCTSWDSIRLAAIYRGNFKTTMKNSGKNDSKDTIDHVFDQLQSRVAKDSQLNKKVQLFLVEDPDWRPGTSVSATPDPVILALSKSIEPEQATERPLWQKIFCGVSLISTLFTTFTYALSAFALNNDLFDKLIKGNDLAALTTVRSGILFIMIGIALTSVLGESAHFLTAKKHKMKIGVGVPLPSIQIGTFGNITPLRSFPPSRTALFDVAMSGPIVSIMASTVMVIIGLFLTINTPVDMISKLAIAPVALMKSSFFVGTIVSLLAPKIMILPLSQPIPIHPLFFVGLSGLFASAVNLLPVGRLDGGRACTAVFGRRIAFLVSLTTLFFMAVNSLSGNSAISIFWGLLVIILQRSSEIPTRDEITEVSGTRFRTYILSTILSICILAPFPGGAGSL